MVKRFVELMEGTIEAISTEGVGTEFIIKTDFLLVSRALLETTNRPSTVSVKQQIMHAKSEHQENVSADVSDLYRRKTTAGKTGENGTRVIFMTEIRR
ncbi:ATP-binding protein [Fusicatenibacter sp. CLA-AA-H241]|nr:ATP-binding protein [Oliverpabstia intestinalis]